MYPVSPGTSHRRLVRPLILILFVLACALPSQLPWPGRSPQASSNILVSLDDPLDGESYPASAGLSVHAQAISDSPISRMELWADGKLVEEYRAPEDKLGFLTYTWVWSPETTGTHSLLVRAYTNDGQSAFSNAVHLTGINDPGFTLITRAEVDDTVLKIAERYHVSALEILRLNPGLTASGRIPASREVFIHISPTQGTSRAPGNSAITRPAINLAGPVASSLSLLAPPPPTLQAAGQGCDAVLTISDQSSGESGFQVYRLKPGAVSFSKLAALPAHNGADPFKYTDPGLYGSYQYYVAVVDGSGAAPGNLAAVSIVDPSCAGAGSLITDLAALPPGVQEYYLYVAVNNGTWRRFPSQEFTYIKRSQNLDLAQVASSLAPQTVGSLTVRGEVWGMVNGNAEFLGNFEKTFKPASPPVVFNPPSANDLFVTSLEVKGAYSVSTKSYDWVKQSGSGYEVRTFRWGTDTGASQGIWQVASAPFPKEASLNPACLLLTGQVGQAGTPGSPYEFPIDLSALKPVMTAGNQKTPFQVSTDLVPLFSKPYSPQKLTSPGQQVVGFPKLSNEGFNPQQPVAPPDPCAMNISPGGILTYYVRILPANNQQPAGKPSNTVILTHDPTPPPPIKINDPHAPNVVFYEVKIVNFTGVHAPEATYENCVEIVKNPFYPNAMIYKFGLAKPGDVVCPDKFTGEGNDFWDDLSNAVESAFNFISDAYNKLSDWAVKLVEELNPLCQAAKLTTQTVGSGQGEVKDACHYVAELAVAAAKTYVGLPPTLPNYDQLTGLGKDYLVELAAEELEAQGVPCPDVCKQAIKKGVDYSLEQVKNSMSNSACFGEQEAHDMGIEPLCAPKGVITKPDPRGQPAPAVVEVQVTRKPGSDAPGIPQPTSCHVYVGAYAKNDSHVGQQWLTSAGYEWTGVPIEGYLLGGGGLIPVSSSSPSTSFPIILNPQPYWLPGHETYVKQGWKPASTDDWNLLYEGAMATLKASGSCTFHISDKDVTGDIAVQWDSKQVGPLGKAWPQFCHPNCP